MWGQPSALVDPTPDLEWIHQIQRLRCSGIGYLPAVGTAIPCGVKSELSARGHAYLVMRNRTENDGPGRGTITVDDQHCARAAHALILIDIGFDPAARVLRNPNRRVTCSNPREQNNRRDR
jgi:hypothetical protein